MCLGCREGGRRREGKSRETRTRTRKKRVRTRVRVRTRLRVRENGSGLKKTAAARLLRGWRCSCTDASCWGSHHQLGKRTSASPNSKEKKRPKIKKSWRGSKSSSPTGDLPALLTAFFGTRASICQKWVLATRCASSCW